MKSLLALGPVPASAAPNAASLIELIDDLESDVLWESGVYEIGDWVATEFRADRGA